MNIAMLNQIICNGVSILMLMFLLYLISKNEILSVIRTKAYKATIIIVSVIILCEQLTIVLDGYAGAARIINITANIIGFSASLIAPLLLSVVYCERLSKKMKLLLVPIIFDIVLFLATPFTGWMFLVSKAGVYSRGPLYFLYIAMCVYSFSILVYANYVQSRYYQTNEKIYLSFLFGTIIVGSFIQVCIPALYVTWQAVTLSLVMYYIFQRELQFKYDSLTGVLNRDAFEKKLVLLEGKQNTNIIFFDLNDFKIINDKYGHQVGDRCIKITASAISKSFRKIGNCYRIGGDEFCVLGEKCDEAIIKNCISDMILNLKIERAEFPILPHIAYGYSSYKIDDGKDIMYALNEADRMMYRYKNAAKKETVSL